MATRQIAISILLAVGCATSPIQRHEEPKLKGPAPVQRPEQLVARQFYTPADMLCDGRRISITDLVYRADALAPDALMILRNPNGRQGCVTRAVLVAGRMASPEGSLAIAEYVEAEVGRFDPARISFRGENVGYAIETLGFRLGQVRQLRPNDHLGAFSEYSFLVRLLDPRWLSITPPPGRIDDSSSRRESVAVQAFRPLFKYLDPDDQRDILARIGTMPTVHPAVRAAARRRRDGRSSGFGEETPK